MARPLRRRRFSPSQCPLISDVWGNSWRVSEQQPTAYGFAIHRGWPHSPVSTNRGKAAVIVTRRLAAHLHKNVQRPHFLPLPMGRKTLRRVRKLLGLDHRAWIDTRLYWWIDRIDDLGTLSCTKFAAKHGHKSWTRQGTMSAALVARMRTTLLGQRTRPFGWWKAPQVQAVIKNRNLTLEQIAEQLEISPITVSRIRRRLRDGKTKSSIYYNY